YAGVKKIKFGNYFVLPMGTVEFPMIINGLDDSEHRLTYRMDGWKPDLDTFDKLPVKDGKSNINDIKIIYNTDEKS
ncbi:hypothetical protein, partial [Fructilactobacillus florum]